MKWINNYAWFGRKAGRYVIPFYIGLIAMQQIPDYAFWVFIPVMIVFGLERDTEIANRYWKFRRRD